jgi:hypothetical protein
MKRLTEITFMLGHFWLRDVHEKPRHSTVRIKAAKQIREVRRLLKG